MEAFPDLDFTRFHQQELPRRLAGGNAALAYAGANKLEAITFKIANTDLAYTYQPSLGGIDIIEGVHASTVITLNDESWQGLVYDLDTTPGLLYGNRIHHSEGELMNFIRWEPVLRAMFHGLPVYDPDKFELKDASGCSLNPAQQFTLQNTDDELRGFLDAAGYLLITDVFDEKEIQLFREQAEYFKSAAVEGDKRSWWGRNEAGDSVLCRVIDAGNRAPFKDLYSDERIKRLGRVLPDQLEPCSAVGVDGVTVIYKNPAMVEGLSDLPWHRDCGMGGHAVMCPMVICSIYLYDASEQQGPLRFLPGSHKATYGFAEAMPAAAVSVPARAGDISLHYSDVMHSAPAPTADQEPYRVSVLLSFQRKDFQHHRGDRHYNDVLLDQDDGQVEHLQKVIDRSE